jgi:chromosomal replication initiator protein
MKISPYVFPGLKFEYLPLKKFRDYSINPETILKVVADSFAITVEDMVSSSRKYEYSEARHMFCGITRNYYKYQFNKISKILGNRHHSTAINSVNIYDNRCQVEEGYKDRIEKIITNIDYYRL